MHTLISRRGGWLAALLIALIATHAPAQAQVRIVVDRDFVNIRTVPAIGAEVVGSANAGTTFTATGRSPDNEWLQINFAASEAWIGTAVVAVLEGDINSLPVRDPRTIPYGGTAAPRSGFTDTTSDIRGTLPDNGVRVRGGPSTAYPVLADALRFSEFFLLGRTADNRWLQVNFNGTLGWVAAQYVEIQDGRTIIELPVDGVVASQPPLNFETENEFFGILRNMRDRLDISQVSLDEIQRIWTDAALGNVPVCGAYPARPTGFNVPRPIYAEYFALIDPLLTDYNAAMADLRNSINLLVETCQRPGSTSALISPPVTSGGLELANSASNAFDGLRRRIDTLLPELGPNDCVFAFGGRVDILPTLAALSERRIDPATTSFDLATRTRGYCFDATRNNVGRVEILRPSTNYGVIVAVSPLDDPTNFIATASAGPTGEGGTTLTLYPITFPKDGRYLIIIALQITEGEIPQGQTTLLVTDFPFGTPQNSFLALDEENNVVVQDVSYNSADGSTGTVSVSGAGLNDVGTQTDTTNTSDTTAITTIQNNSASPVNIYASADTNSQITGTLGVGETATVIQVLAGWYQLTTQNWVQAGEVEVVTQTTSADNANLTTGLASTSTDAVLCPGVTLTCDELFSCAEVQACVGVGSTQLDPNGNGIACDASDGFNPLGCNVPVSSP